MKNIDVDIYVSQLISFFNNNPNDLIDLIGDSLKEDFYAKIKEQCLKNVKDGDEVSLTHKQIIDIVVKVKKGEVIESKVHSIIQETKFGNIFLN
jgi:hypothetical protein